MLKLKKIGPGYYETRLPDGTEITILHTPTEPPGYKWTACGTNQGFPATYSQTLTGLRKELERIGSKTLPEVFTGTPAP